ncbi:MAG: hypothetical protein KDJ44_16505 [Rhodoblastus sp.]|nr:hypothetical protein [Rhodoblastus sp.]
MQTFLRLVDVGRDIDLTYFAKAFAPYERGYVSGAKELLSLFALAHPKGYSREAMASVIAGWHEIAVVEVPDDWKRLFKADAHWDMVKPQDIVRACAGHLVRFDRACQTIKALELAFRHSARPGLAQIDVAKFLRIRPAIYSFVAQEPRAWLHGPNNCTDPLVKELSGGRSEATERKAKKFLREAAAGGAMTLTNATRIQSFLRDAGVDNAAFKPIENRNVKSCSHESCFVHLSAELVSNLDTDYAAGQATGLT